MEPLNHGFTLLVGTEHHDGGCRLHRAFVDRLCANGQCRVLLLTEHRWLYYPLCPEMMAVSNSLRSTTASSATDVLQTDDVAENLISGDAMFSSPSAFLSFVRSKLPPEEEYAISTARLVAFDSLDYLIIRFGLTTTLQIVTHLTSDRSTAVLAVVSAELLADDQLARLVFIAALSYRLQADVSGGVFNAEKRWRSSSSKVKKEMVNFRIADNGSCHVIRRTASNDPSQLKHTSAISRPTHKLEPPKLPVTFNLGIRGQELTVKQSLVLPYMDVQKCEQSVAREAKVIYEFDEADDVDVEDPDDNLDI